MKSVRQFLRHALNNSLEHGRAIIEHGIGVQLLAGVHVTPRETLERCVVESAGFFTSRTWLEQHFHAMEMSAPEVMMFPSGSTLVLYLSVSAIELSSVL